MATGAIRSSRFTYSEDKKQFVVEASSLGRDVTPLFSIEVETTGQIINFQFEKAVKDSEGDVQYWQYRSPDGYSAFIFND